MTLHQWEQLSEDGNGGWACRMPVPGGWLYRHSTPGTVEQYQHMMVFVPAPPDPPLIVVGNAKPADVNWKLGAFEEPKHSEEMPAKCIDFTSPRASDIAHDAKIVVYGDDCLEVAARIVSFLNQNSGEVS